MWRISTVPLPRGWRTSVKQALLHAVGLERLALAEVRAGSRAVPIRAPSSRARTERAPGGREPHLNDARHRGFRARFEYHQVWRAGQLGNGTNRECRRVGRL